MVEMAERAERAGRGKQQARRRGAEATCGTAELQETKRLQGDARAKGVKKKSTVHPLEAFSKTWRGRPGGVSTVASALVV